MAHIGYQCKRRPAGFPVKLRYPWMSGVIWRSDGSLSKEREWFTRQGFSWGNSPMFPQ